VYDGVSALQDRRQFSHGIGVGQIERAPVCSSIDARKSRWAAHYADDVVVSRKTLQQSGSDVSTCSGDDDSHEIAS
jgi:hypothetical protein